MTHRDLAEYPKLKLERQSILESIKEIEEDIAIKAFVYTGMPQSHNAVSQTEDKAIGIIALKAGYLSRLAGIEKRMENIRIFIEQCPDCTLRTYMQYRYVLNRSAIQAAIAVNRSESTMKNNFRYFLQKVRTHT